MTDTIEIAGTRCDYMGADWYEIDPWGASPKTASLLPGMGGEEPSADPAYVFATSFLAIEPGPFRMRLLVEGARESGWEFLLEITNRSDFLGSPPVRMRLELALAAGIADAGGHYDVVLDIAPHAYYSLAGFIHNNKESGITALRVLADRPVRVVAEGDALAYAKSATSEDASRAEHATRDTARLAGTEPPNFTNPYSQPHAQAQDTEPAFFEQCAALGMVGAPHSAWPEAFILQALTKYGAVTRGGRGIGFDCADQALPWALLKQDVSVLMTRFEEPDVEMSVGAEFAEMLTRVDGPHAVQDRTGFTPLVPRGLPEGYFGIFDFAWWIASRDCSISDIVAQLNAIASALRPGGMAVLVLSFFSAKATAAAAESGTGDGDFPLITRAVIERLALELIAQGHSVAQLRFGQSNEISGESQFGMIFGRSSS